MKKKTDRQKKQPASAAPAPKTSMSERLSNYICPMLLGGAICFATVYSLYRPLAWLYTLIFVGAEFLLFALFDVLKSRKIGGLLYTLFLVIIEFGAMYMMISGAMSGGGFMGPVTWFYGDEGNFAYEPYYLNAIMLGGGFFIISILYYFTQIRYRSLGVMLCILFPFVIYAKRAEEMPEIVVTLIVTMFIAVMVHNRRIDPSLPTLARGRLRVNLSYIISIAIFVSITGAATMMLDKPVYVSELEKNANFFNYTSSGIGASSEQLSNQSSQRYSGGGQSTEPLFYLETDGGADEYYLRRNSFDFFNGDVWEVYTNMGDYNEVYSSVIPEYSYDGIVADMSQVIEQSGGIGDVASLSPQSPPVRRAYEFSESFSPSFLPAPYGTITDRAKLAEIDYRKFRNNTIMRTRNYYDNAQPLKDSFEFIDTDAGYYAYAEALGLSGFIDDEQGYFDLLLNNDSEAADRLLTDYSNAFTRYLDMSGVSDRIAELALQITADCDSDFEKARALEQYFTENGYVYDLDYVPEDTSIEYFIFEGKTGVCSSYATAMTLMARAVGLPARYTEGYAAFEKVENDSPQIDGSQTFLIRESHAHAFVEVYIPGAGWLTFDPTVPDYKKMENGDRGATVMMIFRVLSKMMIVIAVAFVVIFVLLLDRFAELILRLRLPFMNKRRRTLALYRHVIWLADRSTGEMHFSYTVKMLSEYFKRDRGCAPDKLFALFEKVCFGGAEPTDEEWKEAYADYKRCYKYLRKRPKEKKASPKMAI